MSLTFEFVGPERAALMLGIIHEAFAARPVLDPPADALGETVQTLAEKLGGYGGLIGHLDGEPVGSVVLDPQGSTMWLRRFAVVPGSQGNGLAQALVAEVIHHTLDTNGPTGGFIREFGVIARVELQQNVRFWHRRGFREVVRNGTAITMLRPLHLYAVKIKEPEQMHRLGEAVAGVVGAGDVLVLSGELGAGKTTFTQGLGTGLGVRGQVTSPTFVIAREHPSLGEGPALVHVDAYRLGSAVEIDDLDLDTELDEAVTVIEWGTGVVEDLADSRLELRFLRALTQDTVIEDDPRRVEFSALGPRWTDEAFARLVAAIKDVGPWR